MEKIKYLNSYQTEALRARVKFNLSIYEGEGNFDSIIDNKHELMSTISRSRDKLKLKVPQKGASEIDRGKDDSHNCMEVYKAFKKLTPQQAYDERFWVFLSHSNEFLDYMRCRWPHKKNQSKDERINHFKLHFFSKGNRGRTRNNGISRLWWLGYCADKVVSSHEMKGISQKRALDLLFYRQDVRASLVERPGTAMCLNVFRAIIKMLDDSYRGDKDLFDRKKFRLLMEKLNSQGGVVLYDALSISQIIDLSKRLLRSSND